MLYWPCGFNSLRWLVSKRGCVLHYSIEIKRQLLCWVFSVRLHLLTFFFPILFLLLLCQQWKSFFVFSSTWADDLTESISFPKYTVRSWSVCFLVCPIAFLLYTLMVSSHHRLFFFLSIFCGVSHVHEQLHKTIPLEHGASQCKKAWRFPWMLFLLHLN